MKKFWVLLLFSAIICTTSAYAFNWKFWAWGRQSAAVTTEKTVTVTKKDGLEIIPTMDTVSNSKNTVWVGTFQLIWNDLIDEIIKRPVEFGVASPMADSLNKKAFTVDDLEESSYYKKLALASPKVKKEIEKAIKEKFNETSDILDKFDWTPAQGKYILYAMLKKDFEYIKPFDKLEDGEFKGSQGKVKYFGINDDSNRSLRSTVNVLFYNGKNDYAISLKSKQGDTVFLYGTDDEKTFDVLYKNMQSKAKTYTGSHNFGKDDEFKAPLIELKAEREFPELCNKPIKYSDYMISKAIETVQFKMNETGVKLKSEAGMMVELTCAPGYRPEPRYFYFNDRYIIFLQEKSKPYFALKVEDAKSLQK